MATIDEFELVLTTYAEIRKEHPDWSDLFIEDYMARGRDLAKVAESVDDNTENAENADGSIGQLRSIISRMDARLADLEQRSADSNVSHKFAIINKRIDDLIDKLIEEIRALDSTDFQNKLLSFQGLIQNELELLNTRAEEAWDTGIEMEDTQ